MSPFEVRTALGGSHLVMRIEVPVEGFEIHVVASGVEGFEVDVDILTCPVRVQVSNHVNCTL